MSEPIYLSDDPLAAVRQIVHILGHRGIKIKGLEINRYELPKLIHSPEAVRFLTIDSKRGYTYGELQGEICGVPFAESR